MVDHNENREAIRRSMGEAVVLSPDDPRRQEVETLLNDTDLWAHHEWKLLVQETTRLREHVPRTNLVKDVPEGLERRLLTLPAIATARSPSYSRLGWLLAGAAAVLILGGFIVTDSGREKSRLQTLAVLAINNHVNHVDDEDSFQSTRKEDLERHLSAELDFDVLIPGSNATFDLVGGRKCKLGTHPVAYTLWRGRAGKASLFQFKPIEFELPGAMKQTLVHAHGMAVADGPNDILVWTEGSRGYVLVCAEPSDLNNFSSKASTKGK